MLSLLDVVRTRGQPYPSAARGRRRNLLPQLLALLAFAASPAAGSPLPPCADRVPPPVSVIQFFDWYGQRQINAPDWTHRVDWAALGLREDEIGSSRASYDVQLGLIAELGVDGVAYEYYGTSEVAPPPLSTAFLASLEHHGLKVALFYDLEYEQVWREGPVLSRTDYIHPSAREAEALVAKLAGFYERVPRSSWLLDRRGRLPILVYGYGFDRATRDAAAWQGFWASILGSLEARLGVAPVVYWSATGRIQLETGFQQFPGQLRPFNFVLDTPHPQLAPGSVTWNVNFDNLGVQRRFGFVRVVRDDPRYLQEMLWLAKRTSPELLFVYGWNEFYEGANVIPDETYGTSRFELVKAMLRDVAEDSAPELPCTLLVVDDYADAWTVDDWRLGVEERLTLYPLRRLAPQADAVLASRVSPGLLSRYDLIVVLAQRSPRATELAARAMRRARVVFLGPATASSPTARRRFAAQALAAPVHGYARLVGADGRPLGALLVRDDVLAVRPAPGVATAGRIVAGGISRPALLRHGDDWWLNAFTGDGRLLAPLFAAVYGRPLEPGIMHGEGPRSQRVEVTPDGRVTRVAFEAPAAFRHEPLPLAWRPPPPPGLP